MEAFVIANKGTEDIVKKEISELISTSPKVFETIIKFPIKNYLDLCTICYKSQSINKAVLLLYEFDVEKSLNKTISNFKITKDFDMWCSKKIRIDCMRVGEHDFNSVEISAKISAKINEKYKVETDFDHPNVIFFLYVYNNKAYFGVDFSGIDLSKRQYKIFHHPESLKGTIGYYIVRQSGFSGKEVLIDPFMGSGMIIIEAGLYALNFPVQYYSKNNLAFVNYDFFKEHEKDFFENNDKNIIKSKTNIYGYDSQLRYLNAVQKNSKLAGIAKFLNLSKVDIEWLDTKFEKGKVDLIVTDAPRMSKNKDLKKLEKVYNELFYQANYVLKKRGKIVIFSRDYDLLEDYGKKHKFKINKKYLINQGQEQFNIVIFEKVG